MQSDTIEITKYLKILRRGLRLITLGTLISGVIAGAVSFMLPPAYEAEADVASVKTLSQFTISPDYKTLSEAQLNSGLLSADKQKGFLTLARGNDIAAAVVAELGTTLAPDERLLANLIEMVKVSADGDLIRIKVQNRDPQKAAVIATTWAQVFVRVINQLYTEAPTNLEQIQTQADIAGKKYSAAESALGQFIGDNQIEALNREISSKQNTINDLYAAQRNLDRLMLDARLLEHMLGKDPSLEPSDAGIRLATLMLYANSLTLSDAAKLPTQLQINPSLLNNSTEPDIRVRIESLITALEGQKKRVEAQLSDPSLQREVLTLQKEVEAESARKQELTSARDLTWSTYKSITSKVEEVRIAQQSSAGTIVRLAGPGTVPERPIATNKIATILAAMAVGLILSSCVVFFLDYLGQSARSKNPQTND